MSKFAFHPKVTVDSRLDPPLGMDILKYFDDLRAGGDISYGPLDKKTMRARREMSARKKHEDAFMAATKEYRSKK